MPTSQADMEKLLEDKKDGGQWRSDDKELLLGNGRLKAYTAGEMQQLCSLIPKACPEVKELYMWNNELDDAHAAAVPEALERLPHLEKLSLEGNNKFGGEAAAKIFIAAVRHCLHLDVLRMPEQCDPNTVDWAQLGVTMSAQVLAAAEIDEGIWQWAARILDGCGRWDWGPMVKKQREMQAAGLVAPLPTVPDAGGSAAVLEVEKEEQRQLEAALALSKLTFQQQAVQGVAEPPLAPDPALRLPSGWASQRDSASGRLFYFNTATGHSQWEMPLPTAGAGVGERQNAQAEAWRQREEAERRRREEEEWRRRQEEELRRRQEGAGVQAATQAVAHASLAAAVEELKFVARQLIMGDAGASTRGLKDQVGLTHATMLSRLLARGWEAIEDEWLSTGDERDEANYRYIRFGKARDPNDMPPFVKEQIQRGYYHGGSITEADFDRGHDGMTLKDFVQHENSRLGKLNELHVFALRAYTSGSFPRFNKPLRDAQTPHPFKMTLYYLDEALRLQRTVEATKDRAAFLQIKYLYRGMKDMVVDAKKFEEFGGTEMACMSTTATKEVALKYAASKAPLLFRYKTRGNARGVSIQFLSMFPGEDEYLYPPLTLLLSEGPPVVEDGVTVFDVSPQMS